jgi:hypothetical protein
VKRCLAAVLCFAFGCAAQTGIAAGFRTYRADRADFPFTGTFSTQAALLATPVIYGRNHLVLAVEGQGRIIEDEGAEWSVGPRVGYQFAPKREYFAPGFEATFDVATPIRSSTLFPRGERSIGLTLGPLFWLADTRDVRSENSQPWYGVSIPHLVPYFRVAQRRELPPQYASMPNNAHLQNRWCFELGVAFRAQLQSDLF